MREIEQKFSEELLALDLNDLAFEARKYSINIKRTENLDLLKFMNEHKKENNQKAKIF